MAAARRSSVGASARSRAPPALHITLAPTPTVTAILRTASRQLASDMTDPFASPAPVRAPEFPEGLEWAVGAPQRLAELRGRVVVVDLWTYG